jgi:acetolactate synthase regulatory subunit
MSDPAPRVGKTFTGHIHRIDEDGNGIIETHGGHINIGPVLPGTEGEWVEALKLPGGYARCNRNKVIPDDYKKQINKQFPHDLPLGPDGGHVGGILGKRDQGLGQQEEKYRPIDYNEWIESSTDSSAVGDVHTHTAEVDRISNSGNGIIYVDGREITIGPIKEEAVGSEIEVKMTGEQSVELLDDSISLIGETRTVEIAGTTKSGKGIICVQGRRISIGQVVEAAVGTEIDVKITGKRSVELLDDPLHESIIDTHTVEIDRITNSGDGIIHLQGRTINIGPIKEKEVGSEIEVERTGDGSANLLDHSVRPIHTAEVDRISHSGNGVVYVNGQEISIGPMEEEAVGSEIDIIITGHHSGLPVDETVNKKDSENIDDSRSVDPVEPVEKNQEKTNNSPEKSTENNSKRSERTLSDLRDQAIADAEENVSANEKSSSSSSEYTRSSKVKSYVKARADGQCEGCGKDAPFVSKTDEPYLHAHHVYELSEGGPDTPDTVIALCPNCHYRIHHGRDGDEYNQELIEKLQKIEDTPEPH